MGKGAFVSLLTVGVSSLVVLLGATWRLAGELGELRRDVAVLQVQVHGVASAERLEATERRVADLERWRESTAAIRPAGGMR